MKKSETAIARQAIVYYRYLEIMNDKTQKELTVIDIYRMASDGDYETRYVCKLIRAINRNPDYKVKIIDSIQRMRLSGDIK